MTNFNFRPFLFFALCILLNIPSILSGQTDNGRGIFRGRTTSQSDGGGCLGCPPCFKQGDIITSTVEIYLESDNYPCDLHLGVTYENGTTSYNKIIPGKSEYFIFFGEVDCAKSEDYYNFMVDLYCDTEVGMVAIEPCQNNDFDEILPDALEDECSLATSLEINICCNNAFPPTSDPNSNGRIMTGRNSLSNSINYNGTIYSTEGKLVHTFMATENTKMEDIISDFKANSGIYFVCLRNGLTITTKKVFKF